MTDCWEWKGAKGRTGYGYVWRRREGVGGTKLVHRWIVELLTGKPIPSESQVHHICRNRSCIRPSHLELVRIDEHDPVALNTWKTHCIHGHPLSGTNLYINPTTGHRYCRICVCQARKRYKDRRRLK